MGDENIITACQNEYTILSKLNHPSIVKVYKMFRDTSLNKCFTVMERVQGQDLFNSPTKSVESVKSTFKKLLEAVAYLHNEGVCHRDLKPDNLIVDEAGNIKIIDFNAAVGDINEETKVCGGTGLK